MTDNNTKENEPESEWSATPEKCPGCGHTDFLCKNTREPSGPFLIKHTLTVECRFCDLTVREMTTIDRPDGEVADHDDTEAGANVRVDTFSIAPRREDD